MASQNLTYNVSMKHDLELETICSDPANRNSSMCNKAALGISLSTPILMMSSGVLGNVLALVVLYTSKKEFKRTVFFVLLAGLAWTDVIGQMCVGPIAIITYANNLKWQGGDQLCMYHGFMMVCFGLITPLIVCSMSLERLLALRFTYFYARVITRRTAQYTLVACWLFTLFFCTWPLMGLGSYELQFPGSWCFLNFHRESEKDTAYAYVFSLINIVVIATIFVCNVTVVVTLLQMRRTRKINNSPSIDRKFQVRPKSLLQMEMETQMVWFLGAITLVFTTCWLPLNVHILINQITGQNDAKKDLIGVRLASINQILDPWLYILLRKAMFFKFLRRIKMFVADRKRPTSSRKILKFHEDGVTNPGSQGSYPLHSVCVKVASHCSLESKHSNDSLCAVNLINDGCAANGINHMICTQPEVTILGNSDSESDVFLEAQSGFMPSFVSFDECMDKQTTKRRESSGGDINGNKKLKRLYSLPAYLEKKGKQNGVINI